MLKVLLICGISGSGKSYIEKLLTEYDSEDIYKIHFNKLEQVTTRKPRSQEEIDNKVYRFISQEDYDIIEKTLIAKTNINGDRYGTISSFIESDNIGTVVNTIIVNKLGYDDVIRYLKDNYEENDYDLFTIKVSTPFNEVEVRNNRDINFLKKEEETLEGIYDYTLLNSKDNRATAESVITILKQANFI